MDIFFSSKKLSKQFNEDKEMQKAHGAIRAKKLKIVMASLSAAKNLAVFTPPYSPPHRCHELTGDRKGQLSMDLDHPYRLIFRSNSVNSKKQDGGLDWSLVTEILIIGIEDTHG